MYASKYEQWQMTTSECLSHHKLLHDEWKAFQLIVYTTAPDMNLKVPESTNFKICYEAFFPKSGQKSPHITVSWRIKL